MGINFPNAPTLGQQYPSPPTPGLPVYQWDGEKWISTALPVQNQSGVIAIQVFTTSGTYVPSPGMTTCVIECVGGGGGGGGGPVTAASNFSTGGGGGGGAYSRSTLTATTIGASQSVTVGAGGAGVANANGGTGSLTSFGSLVTASGGTGGSAGVSSANASSNGGPGGATGTGTVVIAGSPGTAGVTYYGGIATAGVGGASGIGGGGGYTNIIAGGNGGAGLGRGGGGAGVSLPASYGATAAGGAGAPGIVIITEYGMQAITGTDGGVVHYDAAQSLTSSQLIQARQNIYAAPFDAMGWSGMQVNGSMDVSQERGTAGYTVTNNASSYVQDGWSVYFNAAATLALAAYPANPSGPSGFPASLNITSSTGLATLAAGDNIQLTQHIEGYRIARLGWGTSGAQPVTIGFWIATTIPGTVSVSIRNNAANRSYITDIAVNAANTWEYKTFTVPGDTTPPWLTTNGRGWYLVFCFGAGSTLRVGTPGSWTATGNIATVATTNFFSATNNNINITGVVVLPGVEAPSATRSPLVMRPFDQELLTCKRYWESGSQPYLYTAGGPAGIGTAYGEVRLAVTKRITPAIAQMAQWQYFSAATNTNMTPGFAVITTDRFGFQVTGATNWAGWCGTGTWSADARL